ncbi:MAG: radical SAM protein [Candidatus Hodarchaeota archaeon]
MTNEIIYIDENSKIPLMGVDFIGIIDRGTNVIELKPLTLCNLRCKYCFVKAGEYHTNFIVNYKYLTRKVREIVKIKGNHDIEIHIAPYGETLLYSELYNLINNLWQIEGIKTISMQSNGLLLNSENIQMLNNVGLTRINISLNTLNENLANNLCACKNYNIKNLLYNIENLLDTKINVLLAPIWFPKENDTDIENIIKYVLKLRNKGYSDTKIQIGIQKYLIYRTGRRLKKIRPKSWDYFYDYLSKLEKKYNIKLKLGPNDFGIHKRKSLSSLKLQRKDIVELEIVSQGRWNWECIGKINNEFGIKVLLKKPLNFSEDLLSKIFKAEVIKANYKDNILTALFPLK